MYSTSSLVAWLLFEFESQLSLSHNPSTRFDTTFRISDHLAEKTTLRSKTGLQKLSDISLRSSGVWELFWNVNLTEIEHKSFSEHE